MRLSAAAMRRVAWFAMACHVLVASGLPLPLGVSSGPDRGASAARIGKDRSRPFPCMDKPCGCATAEQCFANCCCHTPAERLAWAKAHRVEPAVLEALERRVAAGAPPALGRRAASRCRTAAAEPAVDRDAADVCSAYRSLAAAPRATPVAAAPAPPIDHDGSVAQTVILRDMLACGGIVTAWFACGTALPPPRVETPTHDTSAGFVAVGDAVAPSAIVELSARPPRVA